MLFLLQTADDGAGVLLIAEMSTADAGTSDATVQSALAIAKENPTLVAGFICQRRISQDADAQSYLYCTPGVSLEQSAKGSVLLTSGTHFV